MEKMSQRWKFLEKKKVESSSSSTTIQPSVDHLTIRSMCCQFGYDKPSPDRSRVSIGGDPFY